jgi:hypothetical protein
MSPHRTTLALALAALSLGAAAPAPEALELSLQKLMNVEWEPGEELPGEITAYGGQRVRISGFMRNGTTEGETWFDLTNDSCGCGTGKVQHFVRVTLERGTTTFSPAELTLEGVFEVGEREDEDGFVESLYRLSVEEIAW